MHLLKADAYEHKRDVILLQETGLREDTHTRFTGYTTYHLPAIAGETRGCSILVRNSIPSKRIDHPVNCGDNTEVLGVTLTLRHETIQIYNIYHHQEAPLEVSELLALCATTGVFIGGDFNAHHNILGSDRQNRSGQHLAEVMDTVPEATLLNTGEPTHIHGGILDLSYSSPHLSHGAKWDIHDSLASDHFAITVTINSPKLASPEFVPRWNTRKADWPRFREELLKHLALTEPGLTINDVERRLVDALHQAANAAIPQTKRPQRTYKDAWYYDQRVKEYNQRINRARKLNRTHHSQETRDLLRAAIRTAREGKKKIRTEKWLEWCAGMNSRTTLSDLWKQVKIATGQKTPTTPSHPDPESEANRLVASYADRASSRQLSPTSIASLEEQQPAQDAIIQQACDRRHPADTAFTRHELRTALQPRPDTAAGADRVTYSMLRQAGEVAHEELLNVINTSYAAGLLPTAWKEATIHPIPKPREPGKTRPISLLSCLGKTAEKMVLQRLQWVAGPLQENVYAYRRGVGTRDCLFEMITSISGRKAVVAFLDMEKAFELANARAILTALARKGVDGRLLKWTKDFLTGRRARVRFQGHLSTYMSFENGTPQGSILSPYLFNILMEELVSTPLAAGTKVLCYADDIAIISTGRNHLKNAQTAINRAAAKCQDLGLKINFAKTKAVYFNGARPEQPLRAQQQDIEWALHHPYLGVWIDHSLNFIHHTTVVAERVRARLRTMRAITATEGGANFQVLKLFYIQAIRAIVEYSAPLLIMASPNQLEILEKTQNEALRIMLGAKRWAKVVNMRAEADLPKLAHRVHTMNVSLLAKKLPEPKYSHLVRSIQQRLAQDEELFPTKTWTSHAAKGIKTLQVQTPLLSRTSDARHPEYQPTPPWQAPTYHFSVHKLTRNKASLCPADLADQAQQALRAQDIGDSEVYFTDGSVDPDTKRAAAAFVHTDTTGHFRLPDNSSTLQAELVAIEKALEDARPKHKHVVLHTDSLGAIQSLQRHHISDNIHLITSIHAHAHNIRNQDRRITLNWIPSHTGIQGNDLADVAAKDALKIPTVTRNVVPSRALVKSATKKAGRLLTKQDVRCQTANGSLSATWYTIATTDTQPLANTLPRHTRTRLHRLRLGYHCEAEIFDTLPRTCEHCNTPTHAPLIHYIEDCPRTAPYLDRHSQNAPHILQHTIIDRLTQLVNALRPPT